MRPFVALVSLVTVLFCALGIPAVGKQERPKPPFKSQPVVTSQADVKAKKQPAVPIPPDAVETLPPSMGLDWFAIDYRTPLCAEAGGVKLSMTGIGCTSDREEATRLSYDERRGDSKLIFFLDVDSPDYHGVRFGSATDSSGHYLNSISVTRNLSIDSLRAVFDLPTRGSKLLPSVSIDLGFAPADWLGPYSLPYRGKPVPLGESLALVAAEYSLVDVPVGYVGLALDGRALPGNSPTSRGGRRLVVRVCTARQRTEDLHDVNSVLVYSADGRRVRFSQNPRDILSGWALVPERAPGSGDPHVINWTANWPYLGYQGTAAVSALDPDGPAARAGVRIGDRILGPWRFRAGCPQNLHVSRAGRRLKLTITPVSDPMHQGTASWGAKVGGAVNTSDLRFVPQGVSYYSFVSRDPVPAGFVPAQLKLRVGTPCETSLRAPYTTFTFHDVPIPPEFWALSSARAGK